MSDRFERFVGLHVPGDPLILFNVWDAGSARAAAGAGATALATGSWSVAAAQGLSDAEALPLDLAIANAARIVASVDLPVSIDFEGAYSSDPATAAANLSRLAETGAIGCNFEDQVIGGAGLHPLVDQAARIAEMRAAVGASFFINARTDLFLQANAGDHDAAMAEVAIERAHAYADAGASGFFVPGLFDPVLLERVCAASPLPVNFMAFPGAPDAATVASCGIARISHGPYPYRTVMAALTEAARAAFSG